MSDSEPVKRRGRPRVPEEKRKGTLTFRLRADLRERIEARANETGRSVSEEVENLLEISLDPDQYINNIHENIRSVFDIHLSNMIKDVASKMTLNEITSATREIKGDVLAEMKKKPYRFEEQDHEKRERKAVEMIEFQVSKYMEGLK